MNQLTLYSPLLWSVQADSEESAHKTTKQIYEITSLLVEFFRRIVEVEMPKNSGITK